MGHPVLNGAGGVGTGKRALDVRRLVIYLSGHICKGGTGSEAAVQVLFFFFPFNPLYFSLQFSHSVMSDSLQPHGLQDARPPCPSPTPGVYSNSCPLSQWCHPVISSSVIPFSTCLQSFPGSGCFSADTKIMTLTENNARVYSYNKKLINNWLMTMTN